jgi:flagellar protein FlaG
MEVRTMAMEPIGSMMSLQAQAIQPVKPAALAATAPEKFDTVEAQDPSAKLDGITPVVSNAQEKGDSGSSDQGASQNGPTNDQIRKAVEKINKQQMAQSEAIFGIHEETNRVTIKIVDKKTKEVIKELPPEATLDMIAKAWELAGILVDEKR